MESERRDPICSDIREKKKNKHNLVYPIAVSVKRKFKVSCIVFTSFWNNYKWTSFCYRYKWFNYVVRVPQYNLHYDFLLPLQIDLRLSVTAKNCLRLPDTATNRIMTSCYRLKLHYDFLLPLLPLHIALRHSDTVTNWLTSFWYRCTSCFALFFRYNGDVWSSL
jgi:hypothetical protein